MIHAVAVDSLGAARCSYWGLLRGFFDSLFVRLRESGLSNVQIAQTLFVTARTVEGHLTHVFLKLDVKARTEIPAALAAPTQAVPA